MPRWAGTCRARRWCIATVPFVIIGARFAAVISCRAHRWLGTHPLPYWLPRSKVLNCVRILTQKPISLYSSHIGRQLMTTTEQAGEIVHVENGRMGRVAYARIAPNEDLVRGVEKMCLAQGFANAFVRGGLGSLVDAGLGTNDGGFQQISGPAVEIVS